MIGPREPGGVVLAALVLLTAAACSRNLEVWQARPDATAKDSVQYHRLKGIPFYVKQQRYKYTHVLEYRWYRVTLNVTPLLPAPAGHKGGSEGRAESGPTITYVYDVSSTARDSLYQVLDMIRARTASTSGGASSQAVHDIEHALRELNKNPENLAAPAAGKAVSLGMTVEPIVAVNYDTLYYLNVGKSPGATELGVKLSEDGTLSEASGKTAGALREITGAISDLATPAGGILSGIGEIRAATPAVAALPAEVSYRVEVATSEVGYHDRYALVSREGALTEDAVRNAPGHSLTREWFDGKESEAKDKDEGGKFEFQGSVLVPKQPEAKEEPKGKKPDDSKDTP